VNIYSYLFVYEIFYANIQVAKNYSST